MNLENHDISMYDETFLSKTVETRMAEIGCTSAEEYADLIARKRVEEDALFASLHICYSAFFRSPLTVAVLEQIVLPRLIRHFVSEGRREIRVWSAGCAAGQEPYSIAMVFEELLGDTGRQIDYRIFATDASDAQIRQSRQGAFSEESLGNVSLKRLSRWFSRHGSGYAVDPELKARIDFSVFDLLTTSSAAPAASIFSDFDIVLCCNLLFYYKPEARKVIFGKVTACLGPHAYLIVDDSERGYVLENGFHEISPHVAIFRKTARSHKERYRL